MKTYQKILVLGLLSAGLGSALAIPIPIPNNNPNIPAPAPVLGAGWAYDQVDAPGVNSGDSPYIYNLASSATFLITDAFFSGDNYTVFDNGSPILSATAGGVLGASYTEDPNAALSDPNFAHGSVVLGAGAHDLTVQSDVATGIDPAGFFTRLDSTSSVPDAGSLLGITTGLWAGLLGLGTLRKKNSISVHSNVSERGSALNGHTF
jgi:hypothetical protein